MKPAKGKKHLISKAVFACGFAKSTVKEYYGKAGRKLPNWIIDEALLFCLILLSLLVTYTIFFIGVLLSPTELFSPLVNWRSPFAQMIFLSIVSILLLTVDHMREIDLLFAFRDLMVRVYTIFTYGVLLVGFLLIWSVIHEALSLSTLSEDVGPLWLGLSILGMIGTYSLRLLPWLKVVKRRTQSFAKAHLLPPFRNQEWHLDSPLEENRQKTSGYTRPRLSNFQPRVLSPAVSRATISSLCVPLYLWIMNIASRKYNDYIPDEESIKESGVTLPFEWASGFAIPNSVISSTLRYVNMSKSEAILILLFFLIPIILIAVASYNISYVWEEIQYRALAWGVNECGFPEDSPSKHLLLLFCLNMVSVDVILLLSISVLDLSLQSVAITITLISLIYWTGCWAKSQIEEMEPEMAYKLISTLTLLLLAPWLGFVLMI